MSSYMFRLFTQPLSNINCRLSITNTKLMVLQLVYLFIRSL